MIKINTFSFAKLIALAVTCSLFIGANSYAVELVADGSFEAGAGSGNWSESSTNFGSPLCTIDLCGTGTGTGPSDGDWWAWFGGIAASEAGSVAQQTMAFPSGGTATLTFDYELAVASGDTEDFLEVLIDNTVVWSDTGASTPALGYTPQSVDVSAFADGGDHILTFRSEVFGISGTTNFFVDQVSIDAVVPEPNGMVLGLGLLGLIPVLRRRRA